MHLQPIKIVIDLLAPVLTPIFNLSLSTGIRPQKGQIAKLIVVHNGGNTPNHANSGPIFILLISSKGQGKIYILAEVALLTNMTYFQTRSMNSGRSGLHKSPY